MYNKRVMVDLINFIESNNGIGDKAKLADLVKQRYALTLDRKVYTCQDFSIRFSYSKKDTNRISNTILSLSALQKYDEKPFIVCIVTPEQNYMLLANSTFLKKISHSSQELRIDNIKGSFNGGDIMLELHDEKNEPRAFERMYAYHMGLSFNDNLERLVESTNSIVGRVQRFEVNASNRDHIMDSVDRAISFSQSEEYTKLKDDLDERVRRVQNEIAIAAFIDNVNIRGRIIEYLITDNGSSLKEQIIKALHDNTSLPEFKTEDKLGDYSRVFPSYITETDIKTKVLFLDGNPKAYNIDKLLDFLATEKSVYMIYLLGIDEDKSIVARLCSVYDKRLLESTNVVFHWAGRCTRGVAQFIGSGLCKILDDKEGTIIDKSKAIEKLNYYIELE